MYNKKSCFNFRGLGLFLLVQLVLLSSCENAKSPPLSLPPPPLPTPCFTAHLENGGDLPGIFDEGDGSMDNPYLICSYEELNMARDDLSAYYVLGSHIDASPSHSAGASMICTPFDGSNANTTATCEGWEPIGSAGSPFMGNFDGAGYNISDLWVKRNDSDLGLFGEIDGASIRDLGVLNANILGGNGANRIGLLIGQANNSNITHSYATGNVDGGNDTDDIGGLVGYQNGGMITNSYAAGNVDGGNDTDDIGGLLGYQNGGMITNSYATGNVDGGNDTDDIGGLLGYQNGGMITNSYAAGNVDGGDNADRVGALLGVQNGGMITNSYATGNVDGGAGVDQAGGLVGAQGNSISTITNSYATGDVDGGIGGDQTGGLVGAQLDGMITNSYAIGDVERGSGDDAGGLVGRQFGGSIANSYAVGSVNSGAATGALGGLVGNSAGSITGTNYYFDNEGTNGIGTGSACPMTCILEPNGNFSIIFGALFGTMGWDNMVWSGSGRDGHPCLAGFNFGGPGNGCPL